MFKLKFVLPMLAFVLAIGMSFAFTNATEDDFYATGYVELDGQWYQVDVDCQTTSDYKCEVQIMGETQSNPVHSQPDASSPFLESSTLTPKVITDPRL